MGEFIKEQTSFIINPKWSFIERNDGTTMAIHEQGTIIILEEDETIIFKQLITDCAFLFTSRVKGLVEKLVKKNIVWPIPLDYWEADFLDNQCRISEGMIVTNVSPFKVNIHSLDMPDHKYEITDFLYEVFNEIENSKLTIREIILKYTEQFVDEDKELVKKHLYRFFLTLLREGMISKC